MSRSLKKGPFVDEKLYKRIVEMNEKNEKKVLTSNETGNIIENVNDGRLNARPWRNLKSLMDQLFSGGA